MATSRSTGITDANRRITNVVTRNLRLDPRPLRRSADNGRREGHAPVSTAFQPGARQGEARRSQGQRPCWLGSPAPQNGTEVPVRRVPVRHEGLWRRCRSGVETCR